MSTPCLVEETGYKTAVAREIVRHANYPVVGAVTVGAGRYIFCINQEWFTRTVSRWSSKEVFTLFVVTDDQVAETSTADAIEIATSTAFRG